MDTSMTCHNESAVHPVAGFIISWLLWEWGVAPAIRRYEWLTIDSTTAITLIFAAASFIRAYIIRRLGEWCYNRSDRIPPRTR